MGFDCKYTQLRRLEERLGYLTGLEERREVILRTIEEQGKLTPDLDAAIRAAETLVRLEDLYLPYKPKRRTKAQIAREAGLEPLAHQLLADATLVPEETARAFIDPERGVADAKAALEGARQILMEEFSEDAELVGELREYVWDHGIWKSTVIAGQEEKGAKFSDYFAYSEPIRLIPSHRILALFRGRKEGVLSLALLEDDSERALGFDPNEPSRTENRIARHFHLENLGRNADSWLLETVRWTWRVKIMTRLESEFESRLKEQADGEAIQVFSKNLRDLLLAAPAGSRATLGLDPGIRTGVKVAVVDGTGKLLTAGAIYPHEPKKDWEGSLATLAKLAQEFRVELIAVGNGTASRQTDQLVKDLMSRHPELQLTKVMVSEAGASVYSASELAATEFPELDVSLRGAVSIARRLQDPLAELVKIEPKSIGVGQYQHDVNQVQLNRSLDSVVEDCVNAVGVDLNTASAPLLTAVSGLGPSVAANIVSFRNHNGAFRSREDLMQVAGLGAKTFEQAAGFLRIRGGSNPLDCSAVHPEAYPVVERIVRATEKRITDLIGDAATLRALRPKDFTDDRFGEPTVIDILAELEKPGRDPRPTFETASFKEGVEELEHLEPGMALEGVVTNVTNFGAFVDIGVHQDGLVHISQLADKFVENPREIVKAGDVVQVRVLEVDLKRRRVALTMRQTPSAAPAREREAPRSRETAERPRGGSPRHRKPQAPTGARRPKEAPAGDHRSARERTQPEPAKGAREKGAVTRIDLSKLFRGRGGESGK